MTVQVVTVFAPRPEHPKWMDYMPLLRAQRDSARWFGHRHLVVTDTDLGDEFDTMRAPLSRDLMPAMIDGVIARLRTGGDDHLVMVDVDCLVAKPLGPAFDDCDFDVGLTHRVNPVAPINNGAMYVNAGGMAPALEFFRQARDVCGTHWGGDQEAISQAAWPVPDEDSVGARHGCRIKFMNMKQYAAVPKNHLSKHGGETYVVHFKGDTKRWMLDYANAFIFSGGEHG